MSYPFVALVGLDSLKTALLLNAIDPSIGGVLIRGEKGTAKSTAARAFAEILPPLRRVPGCSFNCDPAAPWTDCPSCVTGSVGAEADVPFVTLPLGATEDRVLGTLDFERALREGRRAFQPGLLAAAHRGILYIDEVNLLADHLVDVLLDAAAMGVNSVQREGVSVTHPARFLLVGTMNPEEGDLRPQLLDRFGLMVVIEGPHDPAVRAEVVRRRLAYENNAVAFAERWAKEQASLRERIIATRSRLADVVVEDGMLATITKLCCDLGVESLRADLVVYKAARALAAWDNRRSVTIEDVRAAAELALPHRRRRRPFEQPGLERQKLDDLLEPPPASPCEGEPSPSQESEQTFAPTPPTGVRPIEIDSAGTRPNFGFGRRNVSASKGEGRYVRAVADERPTALAVDATLRAAAPRGLDAQGRPRVERADLHRKERVGRAGTLILFLVDASGSMAARRRMEAVKGAVLGLLHDAYQERDEVAVIAFRGVQAEVLLPPTASPEQAEQLLRALPTGGRTPLAHGLELSAQAVDRVRRGDANRFVLLIVLSDGKANVALPSTAGDPWRQALEGAEKLASAGVASLVLDTEVDFIRAGKAAELAAALGADCLPLEGLSDESLLLTVRQRRRAVGG